MTLPAPFDTAEVGAWFEYGRRCLTWTIQGEGSLHRNAFDIAWVEIVEERPWACEPLRLLATRRRPGHPMRESFTAAGRDALEAALVPAVNAIGFDVLWERLHCERIGSGDPRAQVERAERELEWWRMRADLIEMYAAGQVYPVPVPSPRSPERTVKVLCSYGSRPTFEPVTARLMAGGAMMGWMTTKGEVVPDDAILRAD